jgi:hypothetical protein
MQLTQTRQPHCRSTGEEHLLHASMKFTAAALDANETILPQTSKHLTGVTVHLDQGEWGKRQIRRQAVDKLL